MFTPPTKAIPTESSHVRHSLILPPKEALLTLLRSATERDNHLVDHRIMHGRNHRLPTHLRPANQGRPLGGLAHPFNPSSHFQPRQIALFKFEQVDI